MAKLGPLFQTLLASASLVVGSSNGTPLTASGSLPVDGNTLTAPVTVGRLLAESSATPLMAADPSGLWSAARRAASIEPGLEALLARQQTDEDEPLDAPVDGEEVLDAPVDQQQATGEPLDAPLAEEPVDEEVAAAEPLDAPLDDLVIDQPDEDVELLDEPLPETEVAVVPVAEPVTTAAPVATTASVAKPVSAPVATTGKPVATTGKPVTSVRKKGAPADRVVVVAGRRPLPAALASCDVVVGAGRTAVGSDCEPESVIAAHQPAIPRVPGSAALISTENPSLITSRRDGIQIGTYPEPTLGDSIATTVRAAIFPEDVVVPEVLIVPGEVTVAGNRSREDPIVLWRSELEQASTASGVPIELLATVISMSAQGKTDADLADGRVGPMQVPVSELAARGISEDQWTDPAVNIRVGAELLATGASPDNVRSGAAVTGYLADSCVAGDGCTPPTGADVSELIVYYRLRMAGGSPPPTTVAGVADSPGWPFDDEEAPPTSDPFARLRQDDDDEDDGRERPSLGPGFPNRDDESGWPWSPVGEE